jgi:electron transport complex protein RnfG
MFGIDPALTRINSLTILDQKETPGLGAKITDQQSFLQYWKNKDCSKSLSLRKPPATSLGDLGSSEVNTITGATISSEAVLNIVNMSLEKLKKLKSEGKLNKEHGNAN